MRTHCLKGHALTEDNLRGGKKRLAGLRECLTCHRLSQMARNRKAGAQPMARYWDQTECPNGHPRTEANTRYRRGKPECKHCHSERQRARYWSDPERHRTAASEWQKQNREAATARQQEWRTSNREHVRCYFQRQSLLRRLGKNAVSERYAKVLQNDPCAYCGAGAGQIDHIIPVSVGGGNEWTNLTAACPFCNQSKKDQPVVIFLAKRAARLAGRVETPA